MCEKSTYQLTETAWCPGCGNFAIIDALKEALEQLDRKPEEVLVVSGIGQAAKLPHYINVNGFNGLHGRALPPAAAAKIVSKALTVVVHSGDGDTYGEGGNHFLHNIRRNVDLSHFVHNNGIYGLTKGQASPTTGEGFVTEVQTLGNKMQPFNPMLTAIAAGAGFVARGFSGEKAHLVEIMKQAILHRGYALVDILQPCVSFNKINTYQWYASRVYKLDEAYDPADKLKALEKAMEWGDRIPIGILYREEKPCYEDLYGFLKAGSPLVDHPLDPLDAEKYLKDFM